MQSEFKVCVSNISKSMYPWCVKKPDFLKLRNILSEGD